MSCNGCRVLRKGCKEDCILRDSLQWIQNPQSQGYATLFVAKFFGRAGLFSFISSVQPHQRSALFQSLLFEAAGRTVNPVSGSTGLLWTGNWKMCQSAVETVLQGGTLSPEYLQGAEIDFFNAPGMTSQIKPNASFQKIETIRAEKVTQETTFENSKRRRVREVALSDESETTTFESSSNNMCSQKNEVKLLRLFV